MKKVLVVVAMAIFSVGFSQSTYYNDYNRSITSFNWQTIVADLVLTPAQKDQLFVLNNRYPTYDSWVMVYERNPDRWRYDRYYELERILGRDKYIIFKNRYYKGQNPVAVYNRNKHGDKQYKKMMKEQRKHYKKMHKKGNPHHW